MVQLLSFRLEPRWCVSSSQTRRHGLAFRRCEPESIRYTGLVTYVGLRANSVGTSFGRHDTDGSSAEILGDLQGPPWGVRRMT
jgi:hypothetical protein